MFVVIIFNNFNYQLTTLQGLKEQLASERNERAAVEKKTVSLVRDIKAKWKKGEDAKLAQMREECQVREDSIN